MLSDTRNFKIGQPKVQTDPTTDGIKDVRVNIMRKYMRQLGESRFYSKYIVELSQCETVPTAVAGFTDETEKKCGLISCGQEQWPGTR